MIGNQRVSVAVPHAVFGFEPGHHLHVFLVADGFKQIQPMGDRLTVLFFD